MVRARRSPRAVAAASPTTALIHTALELLLSIDGLQDLRGKTKGVCPQNEIRKSIVKIKLLRLSQASRRCSSFAFHMVAKPLGEADK